MMLLVAIAAACQLVSLGQAGGTACTLLSDGLSATCNGDTYSIAKMRPNNNPSVS
jgi:hypothetical protein